MIRSFTLAFWVMLSGICLLPACKDGCSKPNVTVRGSADSEVCKRARASLNRCTKRTKNVQSCTSELGDVAKNCNIR